MENENTVTLTEAETAFFESGGKTPIVETVETPPVETPPAQQPSVQQSEQQERDDKGRFVPHQALHAEREEHKKTRSELNEFRERQARLEERWNMMQSAQKEQEKPKEVIPDPKEDPIAAVEWTYNQIRQQQENAARQQQEYEQQTQQQQRVQQVVDYVEHNYNQTVQSDAEVADAYSAAFQSYAQEFQYLGYQGKALEQVMQQQLLNFQWSAAQQMQQGVSIGDFIKNIAKTRGWQAKAAAEVVVDPDKMALTEKLDGIAKAIDASKTIGAASGRAGGDALSAAAIADMPAHEFEAWMKVPENARRFKTLMGG